MTTCLFSVVFLAVVGTTVLADPRFTFPELVTEASTRIVSGWEAEEGQFPFQLSLRMVNPAGAVTACGGSILSAEWGLTAAHCTAGRVTIVIRAGAVNLTRPAFIFETTNYYNHPLYNEALPSIVQPHDIGLLKFPTTLVFSDAVQPIRIQSSEAKNRNYNGDLLTASGWGSIWTNEASTRIVSGWEAEEGQFPFQLSLRMVNPAGAVTACGGSILSAEWGLTAAHCTAGRVTIVIRAGAVNLTRPAFIFETTNYYNHPLYNEAVPSIVQPHDIGLLKFPTTLVFSDAVQPIRIQSSEAKNRNYNGDLLTASGWGSIWTNGPSSEHLNWVYQIGVSNQECWSFYGGSSIIVDSTICARYFNVTSQSTCTGDSGGPLTVIDEDGLITQVGVTSFVSGMGCHVGMPAGFIRPGHYHDWFTLITGENYDWVSEPPTEAPRPETTTEGPSVSTTGVPTETPTETTVEASTATPTEAPTETTVEASSATPTDVPTEAPTETTVAASTATPTDVPTEAPTETTVEASTATPTDVPTEAPTETTVEASSATPTEIPTENPPESTVEVPSVTPTTTTAVPTTQVPSSESSESASSESSDSSDSSSSEED